MKPRSRRVTDKSNPIEVTSAEHSKLSQNEAGAYIAEHDELALSSVFQPVFSIAHRKPVGYEALLRVHDQQGNQLATEALVQPTVNSHQDLALDRTCRLLHAHNFVSLNEPDAWLFLNLNSHCLVMEKPESGFMRSLLSSANLSARRVVIEILESEIEDRVYLKSLIDHFRSLGCLIAIDDFGAGHSNFDRIWELQPDLVKIDRRMVQQAAHSLKVERILTGIVSLIHEAGSLVVIEGVESEQEAMVAISCHADMVQGFYFGEPGRLINYQHGFAQRMEQLLFHQQNVLSQYHRNLKQRYTPFQQQFSSLMVEYEAGLKNFGQCGEALFEEQQAIRCYLLDQEGFQLGRTLYSPYYTTKLDIRLAPLLAGYNANWSHRHYHYRAMHSPGNTQVSRPYLSIAGSHMCITMSCAVKISDQYFVFCCDLDWPDEVDT